MVLYAENKADFDRQLAAAGDKLVVVDFFALWCGPCKAIAPKLEELAEEHKEQIVVIKVDVDECEDIAVEYDISTMPTFFFLRQGKVLKNFTGANPNLLTQTIKELL